MTYLDEQLCDCFSEISFYFDGTKTYWIVINYLDGQICDRFHKISSCLLTLDSAKIYWIVTEHNITY